MTHITRHACAAGFACYGASVMFGLGITELIVILVICLIVFGPSRLPDLGASLGRSLREFGKAAKELTATDAPEREQPDAQKSDDH